MPDLRLRSPRLYDLIAIFACVAALALALLIGLTKHKMGTFGTETDFYGPYIAQVENILAGKPYTYQHLPPGYCLLLAGVSRVTGDLFLAAKLISAVSVALLGWLAYCLHKAVFDARLALVGMGLALIALIPYSFLATTDVLTALVIILPLWVLLRKAPIDRKTCFLTGLATGLAYLVRYNSVFIVAGIAIALCFINPDRQPWKERIAMLGMFMAGTLLLAGPWLILNWQINGDPFASTIYVQMGKYFYGLDPTASYSYTEIPDEAQMGTALQTLAAEFNSLAAVILHNPAKFLPRYLDSIFISHIHQLALNSWKFPAYLFVGSGILFLLIQCDRRQAALLVPYLFGHLFLGLFSFQHRYYFFLYPFLFLLVGYALFQPKIVRSLGKIPVIQLPTSWVFVAVLALFLNFSALGEVRSLLASEPRHLLEAVTFLQERAADDAIIVSGKPHLARFANLRRVFPAAKTAEDYLEVAQSIGAQYLVYSDLESSVWPSLKVLKNPDALPEEFELIYQHEPTNTLIYEIPLNPKKSSPN